MPAAFKCGGKVNFHNIQSCTWLDCIFAQAQNIGIVMPPSPLGTKGITTQSSPYALYLISRYAHAYAAAANQNPVVELP
jgi:hypothetical protein